MRIDNSFLKKKPCQCSNFSACRYHSVQLFENSEQQACMNVHMHIHVYFWKVFFSSYAFCIYFLSIKSELQMCQAEGIRIKHKSFLPAHIQLNFLCATLQFTSKEICQQSKYIHATSKAKKWGEVGKNWIQTQDRLGECLPNWHKLS